MKVRSFPTPAPTDSPRASTWTSVDLDPVALHSVALCEQASQALGGHSALGPPTATGIFTHFIIVSFPSKGVHPSCAHPPWAALVFKRL